MYRRRKRPQSNYGRKNSQKITKHQVTQMIKSKISTELESKFVVTFLSGSPTQATSVAFPITEVSQGLGDSNRTGDAITLVDLWFSLTFVVGDVTNFVRMIIVQWAGPIVAATPLDTPDILLNAGSNANNIIAPYNQDNLDGHNLRIIYDKVISLSQQGPASVAISKLVRNRFTKSIQYTAGTNTGYHKMSIHFYSDSIVVPNPSIFGSVLIRYTDA